MICFKKVKTLSLAVFLEKVINVTIKTSAHYIKQIFVIIRKGKFVLYIIDTQTRSAVQLYTFDIYSRSVLKNFISGGLRTIIGK